MIYCFDIDGTICETEGMDYANAKPIPWMVEAIQKLHEAGHEIRYYTARGSETGEQWAHFTERQLEEWGLPLTRWQNIWGKPYADVYVDDRATNPALFQLSLMGVDLSMFNP